MPDVVSCVLMNPIGKILILKRSDKVRTYKECWGVVAGYVEKGEKPIDTAYKEIREEAGIPKDKLSFVRKIEPVKFTDFYENEQYDWVLHPFLFKYDGGKINIDWEHTEYRWIFLEDIVKFETVPHLKDTIFRLCENYGGGSCGGGEER